jgi:hypothetical protein
MTPSEMAKPPTAGVEEKGKSPVEAKIKDLLVANPLTFEPAGEQTSPGWRCSKCQKITREVDFVPDTTLYTFGDWYDGYPEVAVAALWCQIPQDHDNVHESGLLKLRPAERPLDRACYRLLEEGLTPPAAPGQTLKEWETTLVTAISKVEQATKWMLAAAGAIAAVLLAGLQFGDAEALRGTWFWTVVAAAAAAVVAVVFAVWFAAAVLVPRLFPLHELVPAGNVNMDDAAMAVIADRERRKYLDKSVADRLRELVRNRALWRQVRRHHPKGDTRTKADQAVQALDSALTGTAVGAEHDAVLDRFTNARKALVTAAVAVLGAATLLVIAQQIDHVQAAKAEAVTAVLTPSGVQAFERAAGPSCDLSHAGPSQPAVLIRGTPGAEPIVALTGNVDPDCDGHPVTLANTEGAVVESSPSQQPPPARGTPVHVTIHNVNSVYATAKNKGDCPLPRPSGSRVHEYEGQVVRGSYEGDLVVTLVVPRYEECNGVEFTVNPNTATTLPLQASGR